jgi:hypothetical protein
MADAKRIKHENEGAAHALLAPLTVSMEKAAANSARVYSV